MIIPVGDINPRRTTPVVNYLLLLANIGVFVYEVLYLRSNVEAFEGYIGTYALRPDRWQDGKTLFTSMFMHGDIAHLAGNMLFLWIAGDNVEDRLGHVPYLVFYLVAGLVGAAAHVAFALLYAPSMAAVPTLGASGAISGVLGAYLAFFPGSKIKFVLWLIIFIRPFTLPSWGAIGFWVRCGTPSMALRTRTPCQWTVVSSGSRFWTRTRTRSPWRTRISGPGILPP